jgi:hypothetical protein
VIHIAVHILFAAAVLQTVRQKQQNIRGRNTYTPQAHETIVQPDEKMSCTHALSRPFFVSHRYRDWVTKSHVA